MPFEILNEYVNQGVIDLNAVYQREVVWNEAKQGHLIDSLVKNYYVPPVIFSIRPRDDLDVRVAIDGKQRITSINRFMVGLIPQIDSLTGERIWYRHSGHSSARSRRMTADERKEFDKKEIMCVEYRSLTDDQEQEIFRRVQLGVALTTAEKMWAVPGPLADLARDLTDSFPTLFAQVESRRKYSFQLVLIIILIINKRPDKLPSRPLIEKEMAKKEPIAKEHVVLVESVLQVFATMVEEASHVFSVPTKMAPIELIMSTYIIAEKDEASLPELRDYILTMRKKTREKFIDVRTNAKTFKHMKEVIDAFE
ncbi:uncharacterized protein EV422DRAFT_242975 [Fimicolochytrium jonesii]|uniref:uncharacterized protein n=1 Tax=Fimicolochytrium jonesii TaxID=1396493 RepID=UPI0022FE58DA|nr:uncharacterized protein EV422DRAFT_242975 [Fimicolochytrium jonesii]KAI8825036.1 hypothetical protein EV422DRAFT_242975 [Fimicolochytrium jonesii]